jgi:putative heme transporter
MKPFTARPSIRLGTKWRVVGMVIFLLLAAVTFTYAMPRVVDLSGVWVGLRALTWREFALLALLAAAHVGIAATLLLAATPGLKYRQAVVVNEASTAAANTIPGGTAVALGLVYRMLGSWGFSKSRATLSITVSGAWNLLTKLTMAVIAVALLVARGDAGGARLAGGAAAAGVLVAAVVLLVVVLGREDFARRAGEAAERLSLRFRRRLTDRPTAGWGPATARFRRRVIRVIAQRGIGLTASALASYLSLYLILLVSLRAVGVSNDDVDWMGVLTVMAFVRLVAAIPLSPGGLGVVEVALVAGLTSAGGVRAEVVAAVLVYRLLTYVVPVVLGFSTYLYWRGNTSWLDSAPPFDPPLTAAAWQSAEQAA